VDRGEYRQAAGAVASLKQQAHRVLRPVGHSLLMEGLNYFCFVTSPFMKSLSLFPRASRCFMRAAFRA